MNRWDQDAPHGRPARVTAYASRRARKWAGLFLAWVLVTGLLSAVHLTLLIWPIMLALIGYVVVWILRETPRRRRPAPAAPRSFPHERMQFNPAPGWPEPPPGWTPPRGWQPDPSWPPAPAGWKLWVPATERGMHGRPSRRVPRGQGRQDSWG